MEELHFRVEVRVIKLPCEVREVALQFQCNAGKDKTERIKARFLLQYMCAAI